MQVIQSQHKKGLCIFPSTDSIHWNEYEQELAQRVEVRYEKNIRHLARALGHNVIKENKTVRLAIKCYQITEFFSCEDTGNQGENPKALNRRNRSDAMLIQLMESFVAQW